MSSIDEDTPAVETPYESEENINVEPSSIKETAENNESENKVIDAEKIAKGFQEKAKNYLIDQSGHVVIPSYAKWFDMNHIHHIEKKLFPDFFPTKEDNVKSVYRTSESYKNMRDFMINAYRINPLEYLSITATRRSLAGDVTSIIRVHQFLERWGLINYQIDPRTKPSLVAPQYTGHFQVTLDTPKGLVPFIPEHREVTNLKTEDHKETKPEETNNEKVSKKTATPNDIPLNLEARRNVYTSTSENASANNIIQYFCNICGNDTSDVRFHNLKVKSYSSNPNSTFNNASILCSSCFEQGLFPLNFQASDFIKLNKTTNTTWSEQEILLLLEAVEIFGTFDLNNGVLGGHDASLNSNANGQWSKISEFVGTKSQEQCLIKFIQLPIEDRYLNKLISGTKSKETKEDKTAIVQQIAKEILSRAEGENLVRENSLKNLNESVTEQSDLINQVIELTLQKVDVKLKTVDSLEASLLEIEKQRNTERKQVLFERWLQFDRINKLKQQRPELANELDSLLQPVSINEINNSIRTLGSNVDQSHINGGPLVIDSATNQELNSDNLPISIVQPKSYQFWSG